MHGQKNIKKYKSIPRVKRMWKENEFESLVHVQNSGDQYGHSMETQTKTTLTYSMSLNIYIYLCVCV